MGTPARVVVLSVVTVSCRSAVNTTSLGLLFNCPIAPVSTVLYLTFGANAPEKPSMVARAVLKKSITSVVAATIIKPHNSARYFIFAGASGGFTAAPGGRCGSIGPGPGKGGCSAGTATVSIGIVCTGCVIVCCA